MLEPNGRGFGAARCPGCPLSHLSLSHLTLAFALRQKQSRARREQRRGGSQNRSQASILLLLRRVQTTGTEITLTGSRWKNRKFWNKQKAATFA